MNGLDILACDIQNAHLTAKCRENIWTIAGLDLGKEAGSIIIIKMALYGLKSSCPAFRLKLLGVLHGIYYDPTKANPYVWIRPAINPNGTNIMRW